VADDFSGRYGDLLTGSYDCVDRIVLNAFFPLGHNPGGFRAWWRRWHDGCDDDLDNTRLMRMAGRFARRVRAWGQANDVPVIYCKAGERKHLIADGVLDELPLPSRLGSTRIGGIDLNKPRIRAALAAALTLAAAPRGFTVAQFTAQARQLGKNAGYTIRQGAYDLRKLRGKGLAVKLGATRRYHVPAQEARTIAALLAIRDQVIAPILAGVRSPRQGRKPAHRTRIDRDYQTLRIGMQNLFHDLGITPIAAAAP
jgi:hypothetical protein